MSEDSQPNTRLETLVQRARWIIGVERYWPQVVWAGSIIVVFLAVSWLGLWLVVPIWARMVGVAAFGLLLLVPPLLSLRLGTASRSEALRRLDRDSGLTHRPVSASQDRIADAAADPMTLALWDLHRRRQLDALAKVRLAAPSPRIVDRDRYALRAAALVAAIAAGFLAGTERSGRLASAFDWHAPVATPADFRFDAWVDPPPYTGRAPVLLSGIAQTPEPAPIPAPQGSTVVVRWAGSGTVAVSADGGLAKAQAAAARPKTDGVKQPASAEPPAGADQTFSLTGDGRLGIDHDGRRVASFDLRAIPDLAPVVTVIDKPKANLRGSMTLKYKVQDDYGIVSVEGALSQPVLAGKPVTGRTLVEPPKLPLALPNGARGLGQGQTTSDLSEHPWAGAEVTLVVSAKDEGGNTGASAPMTITLPARAFRKPLARALVEQRRDLVLDPDHHERVDVALDALSDAPELFGTTPAVFLGLQAAGARLTSAKSDQDLLGVADLLWSMAVTLEDGDLSQTERDLRALQRQLKDAIARNAPPEEIKKLTEALKEQLQKFLSEMAKNNPDQDQSSPDRQGKSVTPKDLQSLLDRMEQSARNGDMAEAQQLLDQLQNILENLRSARRSPSQDGDKMNQSMSGLDRMMRDQQALRDKTFRRGNQQRPGQRGQPRDPQDPSAGEQQSGDPSENGDQQSENSDLQGQQQALRNKLSELQKQMRGMGLNSEKGFGEAEQAMKDAEQALGEGKRGNDRAVEAQGRALQGLQQGARGLQGQMAQGQGEGEGQQPGETGMGRADGTADGTGTDPLGRERNNHDRGIDAQGGLNAGEGLAERARQVLEELRRRLGDRLRPQDEQDYLERLLKRY